MSLSSKEYVYTTLRDDLNVDSLVDGRVYAQVAPEGVTAPFIVYDQVAQAGLRTMSGILVDEEADYDIWLVATTPESLLQLQSAVVQVDWPANVTARPIIGSDGYDFDHDRYTKKLELTVSI